jgi:hypothetical protein
MGLLKRESGCLSRYSRKREEATEAKHACRNTKSKIPDAAWLELGIWSFEEDEEAEEEEEWMKSVGRDPANPPHC